MKIISYFSIISLFSANFDIKCWWPLNAKDLSLAPLPSFDERETHEKLELKTAASVVFPFLRRESPVGVFSWGVVMWPNGRWGVRRPVEEPPTSGATLAVGGGLCVCVSWTAWGWSRVNERWIERDSSSVAIRSLPVKWRLVLLKPALSSWDDMTEHKWWVMI